MTGFYLPTPAGIIYRLALDGIAGPDLQWATDPEGPVELLTRAYEAGRHHAYVVVPEPVEGIVAVWSAHGEITGYDLVETIEAPAFLTVEAYEASGEAVQGLYRAHREPEPRTVSWTVEDCEPWPLDPERWQDRPPLPDGARWTPSAAWAAAFGFTSFDHLIPGHLSGFHQAASQALLEANPNIDTYGIGRPELRPEGRAGRVRFTVRYPYEITDQERRRRKRARQGLWTSVSVEVELGTDEVWGDNIFTAMQTWERRLAGVLEQSPLPGVACRHCSGTGFLRGGGTDG